MSDRTPDKIHAIGYRTLDLPRPVWPGWPIARTMLVLAWRRRATKMALLACFGVFGVHAVWLVVQLVTRKFVGGQTALPMEQLVGGVHEVLSTYVSSQFFTTALALAVVAAGAVAEDRRAGAFELYFSRPLTRTQYALGKLLGAGIVPLGTLVAPVFLLWLAATGISPEAQRSELWWLAVPALTSAGIATVVLTSIVVGLSAIGQRARTVGVMFVAGLALLSGLCEALSHGGFLSFGYLAPERDLRTVVHWLLEVGPSSVGGQILTGGGAPSNASPLWSLVALGGWAAAGLGALAFRIRSEVRAG